MTIKPPPGPLLLYADARLKRFVSGTHVRPIIILRRPLVRPFVRRYQFVAQLPIMRCAGYVKPKA